MVSADKSAFRSIIKNTAVFGGVQVFNILINLVRGKLIAIFLGPAGVGISALLLTTITPLQLISAMGMNISAMKEIAQAQEKGNTELFSGVIKIFRRVILLASLAGGIITIVISPGLSLFAFDHSNYTITFACLALYIVFTNLASAEITILQGSRNIKLLARSTLLGPFIGLVISTPLYYLYGTNGIAPAMIIIAFTSYFINFYFVKKLSLTAVTHTRKEIANAGKKWLSLGFLFMISTLIGSVISFLLNTYISRYGNIEDVGFFQSATSFTNQYIGLVFMAMSVDYFPRLAAISDDNLKIKDVVNNQSEIVLLIACPLIITLIITAPFIVTILLSKAFLVIVPLLKWMALALFFKAASYPLGYIALAKGDNKLFFWFDAVIFTSVNFILFIAGYKIFGLIGLGYASITSFTLYYIAIIIVARKKFAFSYNTGFLKVFFPLLFLVSAGFICSLIENNIFADIASVLIWIGLIMYCLKELNKRTGILKMLSIKLLKK